MGTHRLHLHHLYSAMDFLEAHKAAVEKELYFRMADLVNADVDVVFYDTTSLHFEVDEADEVELGHQQRRYEPLRKRGYSKNGRHDAPQIVAGLAVTREGLPVRSAQTDWLCRLLSEFLLHEAVDPNLGRQLLLERVESGTLYEHPRTVARQRS